RVASSAKKANYTPPKIPCQLLPAFIFDFLLIQLFYLRLFLVPLTQLLLFYLTPLSADRDVDLFIASISFYL
ncbi:MULTISPECIES: hypothetical protein, partial [unclassified Snodgrassella]|uniref:hypothetical protein n=1 Tax=unclassified Snodgrassella TaxID=2625236 RepID=UPI001E41FA4F